MQLTLTSYNIHSGIGTDGQFDLHRTADVLRETNADVIALQEVGDYRGRTAVEDHPEDLAELLGFHMAYGPNVVRNGRRYGNAILSRAPIVKSRNYDLSVRRREPRGALRCDIDMHEGRLLHLFSLHLGLTLGERRKQESLLLTADILRDAIRNDPVIVCGDFNHWWNAPVPSLVRSAIQDVAHILRRAHRTYPSRWPLFRLDRIFVDQGIRPIALFAHRSEKSAVASDHLPLVMHFETLHAAQPTARHPVQIVA
jgi:endonuclease/exonuclease/phosphatase family metal-dependent hydrolase